MPAEVGSGQVAIYPTFKGFRRAVNSEVDGAAKTASTGFGRVFGKAGVRSGTDLGKGVARGFQGAASNFATGTLKKYQADVASASRAVSLSRRQEQDAAGKLRVAQTQLTEAQAKYTAGSSQLVRAEERVASTQRAVAEAQDKTRTASTSLRDAQGRLKTAMEQSSAGAANAESGFRRFGSSSVRMFGSVSSAGRGLAKVVGAGLGFAAASIAVGGFARVVGSAVGVLKGSITSASDLQQSIGGVDAVFGKSSGQIHRWASSAATSVGLSRNAFNQFAAVIGSQLKGAGIPMDQIAGKTRQLITLGSDLAATYGGTTADAVDALGASLRGEFDPLERFGVSLNQAAVNAKGVKLGFDLVNGSLSTQGKQAATLALIYDRTRDAQGQFGKQTNTLAEQQQILAAQTENLKAKLGTALLPAISAVVGAISKNLTPILKDLKPVFDQIGQAAENLAPKLADVVGKGVRDAGEVLRTFADIAKSVGPSLQDAFTTIGPALGSALKDLAPTLKQVIPDLASAAKDILPALATALKTIAPAIGPIADGIKAAAPAIADFLKNTAGMIEFSKIVSDGALSVKSFSDAVNGRFGVIAQVVSGALKPVVDDLIRTISSFDRLRRAAEDFATGVGRVVVSANTAITRMVAGIGTAVTSGVAAFGRFVTGVTQAGARIGTIISGVNSFFARMASNIGSAVGKAADNLASLARKGADAAARLAKGIGDGIGKAVDVVRGLPGKAVAALGDIGSKLYGSGQSLIGGFIKGIRSKIGEIASTVSGALAEARKYFPFSPAEKGPFSGRGYTTYSGRALATDFAKGIAGGTNAVTAAARALTLSAQVGQLPAMGFAGGRLETGSSSVVNYNIEYNAAPNVSLDSRQALWQAINRRAFLTGH